MSFSAVKSNDKVGLILFTDQIEKYIPPAKGLTHSMRIIREVLGFTPRGRKTNIGSALDFLSKVQRKRAVVFLISDFLGEGYEKSLRLAGRRHDLIAATVTDPRELSFPDVGLLELEDAETGECILVDTGSKTVRRNYSLAAFAQQDSLKNSLHSMGIDQLVLQTNIDYQKSLTAFFRRHERLKSDTMHP